MSQCPIGISKNAEAEHKIILKFLHDPSLHSLQYFAGTKVSDVEREETSKMEEAGVEKLAVTECVSSIVFVLKELETWNFLHTTGGSMYQKFLKCTRIPFGLKSAPTTFQEAMDVVLSSVK